MEFPVKEITDCFELPCGCWEVALNHSAIYLSSPKSTLLITNLQLFLKLFPSHLFFIKYLNIESDKVNIHSSETQYIVYALVDYATIIHHYWITVWIMSHSSESLQKFI